MKSIFNVLFVFVALTLLITQCEKSFCDDCPVIPDDAFLDALIENGVDTNEDGQISYAEAEAVTSLNVGQKRISDLTGIESFVNLENLSCYINQITTLDVSKNIALKELWCSENDISSLDVSNNVSLTNLFCDNNQLTSLDVSNNTALAGLTCQNNQLTSLDFSNNIELEYLYCYGNQLTNLDFSNNTALTYLYCSYNQLTSLDVSNNVALTNLLCSDNQLASLDISNNISLGLAPATVPPECFLGIAYMPSLEKVCVWELPFPPADFLLCVDGSPNVYFTIECIK